MVSNSENTYDNCEALKIAGEHFYTKMLDGRLVCAFCYKPYPHGNTIPLPTIYYPEKK